MNKIKAYIHGLGLAAKNAAAEIRRAKTEQKNKVLLAIGDEILRSRSYLMGENEKDLVAGRKNGIDDALLDRLAFNEARFDLMVEGVHQVISLNDPVGEIDDMAYRPNGIQVGKLRTPLGVIGIIYESRPNVTVDAASLCIKSGNAVILRGGSESLCSNVALGKCISQGLVHAGLSHEIVQLVGYSDRAAVGELITMDKFVDVLVARGGKSLIERITEEATVSVIKHLDGVCHVYVDDEADYEKALSIAFNSKTNRYAVCNAMETLLVAKSVAPTFLPSLAKDYISEGVELRGCELCVEQLAGICPISPATEEDWYEEYLAPVLAIRIVDGVEAAVEHINRYGSNHTDTIVTKNFDNARRFVQEVDSSSVIVNASTRFADGFEYGLGAEIGISTNKLHARGPVGLEGLTSQKFVVFGDGQIRR
ncbi:MAG: glutamate-5-semialdehyde dehydrogenase [Candidatus Azotimanducaceae bacterium]|uniref:Gamma-glutamyl phosphate reductase n=1 Tax=OM182 bacterium TaxID=2510334 RepID=A0A520S1Z9_9GAMM|nr:glutamate-5-semialdehyde dehydrogenase [Gammaproteobacteria bacterium]OUV67062.1 MAG: glutamate-5-semialdehyde dehydrogenase [Gammaproteobacteria bacterium TMED133]RZO76495.1 MAG: glutamate-5-semialdehyde dehydrogenase [OM182 bacterium]